jgi:DNA-binding XRE family transcriptional regulator
MTNFGRELKAQRAACGLSQSQAAACFLDLSVRTLQAWETQEQSPPLWVQHVILERLSKRKSSAGAGRKKPRAKKGKKKNDQAHAPEPRQ